MGDGPIEDVEMAEGAPTSGGPYFRLFNEIGIISQLGRTLFEHRMPGGMTTPQFSVLNHLVRLGDGWTPLRIANAFQVPKTSMTHTLAVLESQGFVELRPNPEDGRSKLVFITTKGRDMRDRAIASLDADLTHMQNVIAPEKIDDLLPILAEIRSYLDRNRPQ